jgi:hypothetical protein
MSLILILAILFNFSFTPAAVIASPQDSLSNVQASYKFGDQLTIEADISPIETIKSVTLSVQPQNGVSLLFPCQLSPSGHITAQIDLRNLSIRVLDRVYYWFDVVYDDGSSYTSSSFWFDYADNRYEWQKSESKWFIIYSTSSGTISNERLQEVALDGLKTASSVLPVAPVLPIQVFVYPYPAALKSALGLSEQTWVAGETNTDLGVIFVSESANNDVEQQLTREITHELVHLLEHSITNGNYDFVPSWLLEGLAASAEIALNPDSSIDLHETYQTGNLIPISQLCNAFPPEAQQSALAYAESASFLDFLTRTYGVEKIIAMVSTSQYGITCTDLSTQVLGKDLGTIEGEWLSATFGQKAKKGSWMDYWPVLFIIPVILICLHFIKKHNR